MLQNISMAKASKTNSVRTAASNNQITDMSAIENHNAALLHLGEA